MSAALVPLTPGPNALALRPVSLDDAIKLAERLQGNPTLPAEFQKPQSILLVILKAADLGLSVAQAFEGLHVIKGRVVMSAAMATGLVMRETKLCERFECVEETDERVVYETKRVGSSKPIRGSFTVAEAKAAGLWKPDSNWQKFTSDMLHARARARCARRAYPDLLLGMPPMREDLEDGVIDLRETSSGWTAPPPTPAAPAPAPVAHRDPKPANASKPAPAPKPPIETTAEPVPSPPPVDGDPMLTEMVGRLLDKIESTQTADQLKAVAIEIQALPKLQRDELRGPYRAQQELLARMAAAPATFTGERRPPASEAHQRPRPETWGDDVQTLRSPVHEAIEGDEREPGSDDE